MPCWTHEFSPLEASGHARLPSARLRSPTKHTSKLKSSSFLGKRGNGNSKGYLPTSPTASVPGDPTILVTVNEVLSISLVLRVRS